MPIVVRPNNFSTEVLKAKGPVLVDFYGEHCVPCHMLRPVLMELSAQYTGLKICVFNTDQEMWETEEEYEEKYALITSLNVMNLPTMLLFEDGEPAASLVGFHTKEELLEIFEEKGLTLQPIERDEPGPDQSEDGGDDEQGED